ncbi:unnamed protein product, partial [Effrenium voratum]
SWLLRIAAARLAGAMAKKVKMVQGKGKVLGRRTSLDHTALLRATGKAVNGKLLYENRALACHGRTVGQAISMTVDGQRYRSADLRYDLKMGRVELLKPNEKVGAAPKSKNRPKASKAGEDLPDATLDEFFQFLSCQLKIQAREHLQEEMVMPDKAAEALFPEVDKHVKPNLGNTERWVPYHTVLGVHELFLMEEVHNRKDWSEKQRFIAIFVFRAHCKRDLFLKAQVPLMTGKFWKDPAKFFADEGPMEKAIAAYRKKTKQALLTNCFRIIPERILKDNDANLVRSIVR